MQGADGTVWHNPVMANEHGTHHTSPINDPVYAFGKDYEPKDVLLTAILGLQEHLARVPAEELTFGRLSQEYRRLFLWLEEQHHVVVTGYHRPNLMMEEEQWLRCQRSAIQAARRRLGS